MQSLYHHLLSLLQQELDRDLPQGDLESPFETPYANESGADEWLHSSSAFRTCEEDWTYSLSAVEKLSHTRVEDGVPDDFLQEEFAESSDSHASEDSGVRLRRKSPSPPCKYELRTRAREKRKACDLCPEKFASSSDLKRHLGTHVKEELTSPSEDESSSSKPRPPEDELYACEEGRRPRVRGDRKCEVCGSEFTSSSSLINHLRIHTGERPYACVVCPKAFISSSALKCHLRIHTGEKPYVCGECKKGFVSSSALVKHSRIHTGDKPYVCDVCQKRFAKSYDQKCHTRRVHTNERPYVCDTCGKGFPCSSQLTRHRRIHAETKMFACDLCKKRFSQRSHLKYHLGVHARNRSNVCEDCLQGFPTTAHLEAHHCHRSGRPCVVHVRA